MTPSPRSLASPIGRRLAACLVLAALATAVPVTFDIGADGFRLDPAAAHAKSGKGKGRHPRRGRGRGRGRR
ncbi:MAG: hypothetical protein R3D80_15615 [Paracoccaceae bacterium]